MKYIRDEWNCHQGVDCDLPGQWTCEYSIANTPRQENGFDCGVFICMYAKLISEGAPLQFTQYQINEHVCEKIAFSILKKI